MSLWTLEVLTDFIDSQLTQSSLHLGKGKSVHTPDISSKLGMFVVHFLNSTQKTLFPHRTQPPPSLVQVQGIRNRWFMRSWTLDLNVAGSGGLCLASPMGVPRLPQAMQVFKPPSHWAIRLMDSNRDLGEGNSSHPSGVSPTTIHHG
ncbi:C-type lectin domain family 1 member A-like [Platysternon megacephalum]|uniref:C-type lectin domain family 1 member A-like n=1 Tax=Platysternon megacephalum TaxID=55544 RepID=A0A4D9DSB3_9SAUR|nr:C-type lectin domain family 1 member A-like [Platysternon megacephalum]